MAFIQRHINVNVHTTLFKRHVPAGKFTLFSYKNNVKVGTITGTPSYCPANAGPTLIANVKGSFLRRHVT